MNKKALQAIPYARVRILPYPIFHDGSGNELPLRNHVWVMFATEDGVKIDCSVGGWTVTLDYDFIAGFNHDRLAPQDGLVHGLLKLRGTIRLHRHKGAQMTPLSPEAVDRFILEQDKALAREIACS